MTQLPLRRALKGANKAALASMASLVSGPIQVDTPEGTTLFGEASGERFRIVYEEREVGVLIGPSDAAPLAELVAHMYTREIEKRALVAETLGRYKELTVIYETGEQLSRVIDVSDVARVAVELAQRSLSATSASLHMVNSSTHALTTVAQIGELGENPAHKDSIENRVLSTGNSEFVESGGTSVMCAPLRSVDRVFGLLRVTTLSESQWTSGDLKLVTSIAANAASALSHAHLHTERLRRQAIRTQVERHVSPYLLEALGPANDGDVAAVLFADLATSASTRESMEAAKVVEMMRRVRAQILDELMQHDAVVNLTPNDMVVAIFVGVAKAAATRSIAAARAAVERIEEIMAVDDSPIGFGLTLAPLTQEGIEQAVGVAATLQSQSEGRILLTAEFHEYFASPDLGVDSLGEYLELLR